MKTIVLMATTVLAAQTASAPPLTFRVEAVKGKAVVIHAHAERRAAVGGAAEAGDEVRTDALGRVLLAVKEKASRFEVYPESELQLAGPDPGVLLVLRHGRLKAFSEPSSGGEERLIGTPGAVLAVHGTRCGLEVDERGDAVLVVFAGVIEVRPVIVNLPPLEVRGGELCRFGPRIPPSRTPLPPGLTETIWDRSGASRFVSAGPGSRVP